MSNQFLPADYLETVHRLALGVEPRDAASALRLARHIQVVLDGVPTAMTNAPGDLFGLDRATTGLRRLCAHSSGRFVITIRGAATAAIGLRLHDRRRRFVSRRMTYAVPADATVTAPRIRQPLMFPGAAYDVSDTATGLRGRVTWFNAPDETPVRWARVVATLDGTVVGRAQGDDRGEFLLLLNSAAGGLDDLRTPMTAQVTIFGPTAPPVATDPSAATRDPLWDLPVETLASTADPDDISTGERLPDGYASTASSTREITFEPGRLQSAEPKFVLTP